MTTTVSTGAVETIVRMGHAETLGLLTAVTLIALLLLRNLAVAQGERARRWRNALDVGAVPLLICFAIIIAVKLVTSPGLPGGALSGATTPAVVTILSSAPDTALVAPCERAEASCPRSVPRLVPPRVHRRDGQDKRPMAK